MEQWYDTSVIESDIVASWKLGWNCQSFPRFQKRRADNEIPSTANLKYYKFELVQRFKVNLRRKIITDKRGYKGRSKCLWRFF